MSTPARARHPVYNLLPMDVEGFASLAELAFDLRSSWNHVTDDVWEKLDPKLWDITHNPWVVLQTVSRSRIESVMADPVFRKQVDGLVQLRRDAAETPAWFQQNHAKSPLTCVAYFSMEFMLSEALPIYSGGLGNVAGDQLKANSDLGVPVVGVGLLYQQGYFRQALKIVPATGRIRRIGRRGGSGQTSLQSGRVDSGLRAAFRNVQATRSAAA